jgi:hypothetical protein
MKKLFLVLVFAFVGIFTANAQVWLGGGLGAQFGKEVSKISVAPEVGYAFNNHWQVALGANYTFSKTDLIPDSDPITQTYLDLEPYVRYVATTIGDKFSLFFDLTGDFGLVDHSGWAVTLRPGIAWNATDHWTAAFRFGFLGYDHSFFGADNGFFLNCELVAPQIRLYYNF